MNILQFDILDKFNLVNFITNRSVDINYSTQSRDEIRGILQSMSDYEFKKIISPRQTHTNNVVVISEENLDDELQDVDGVITSLKGVALTIATADCQSIIIYDKTKHIIGNIHSGWKGTLQKILRRGINLMMDEFNSTPEDILVCIGPSILDCCFEVDKDVVDSFRDNFIDIDDYIKLGEVKDGKQKYFIDTVGINIRELLELGILKENITTSDICTKCSSDIYHSYRAHGVSSGRNVSLIAMK